jgi:PRC-barrel domain
VFEAANIREWRGHDVVDAGDHKIGELEAVYVDTSTDLPSFGTVKVGMPTRHRLVFVPLDRAAVGPGYLKVAYDKKQVTDAPRSAPMASCQRPKKRPSSSTTA